MNKYVLGAFALLVCVGAGAVQAIGQTDTTIYACYNEKKGDLRRTVGPGTCKKDEVETKWNVSGPKGDRGEKGDKGDKGDAASGGTGALQLRVTGSCSPGQFITSIGENGSVTCAGAPSAVNGGVAQFSPGAEPRTILDLPTVSLKLACTQSKKIKVARLVVTTSGDPFDYVFENGPAISGTVTEGTPLNLQVLTGDGTRRFFAQLVQIDGSPSITLHGSVVNLTNGEDSVCLFQWSIATVQ